VISARAIEYRTVGFVVGDRHGAKSVPKGSVIYRTFVLYCGSRVYRPALSVGGYAFSAT
jgi:hypothetical protein